MFYLCYCWFLKFVWCWILHLVFLGHPVSNGWKVRIGASECWCLQSKWERCEDIPRHIKAQRHPYERESGQMRKAPSFDVEDNGELSTSNTLHLQKSFHFWGIPPQHQLDQSDSMLLRTKVISNMSMRKAIRRRECLAAEKVCNICQLNMIPGKDVATFLNLKTGSSLLQSKSKWGKIISLMLWSCFTIFNF
jgi:hypothetical protein